MEICLCSCNNVSALFGSGKLENYTVDDSFPGKGCSKDTRRTGTPNMSDSPAIKHDTEGLGNYNT